tara:strand:+ start:1148 stop:2074 length:927 start_codon:yes stop_codon:yes gene_type:complete
MFLQNKIIDGKKYKYLSHSFRIGSKVRKVSLVIDKDRENYNEEIILKVAKAKAKYYSENFESYFSFEEIVEIEKEKLFFQIFYNSLEEKAKNGIFSEFVKLFLANSMELEGSTITPKLADDIEREKKIMLPKEDVLLYQNSKKAIESVLQRSFRSVINFKQLHSMIYTGVYPHAGKFKSAVNTFGYTEKARTFKPNEVRSELKKLLFEYKDRSIYPFLRPLLFHLAYQKVHPFVDGNSRLGRILLVVQMLKLNYPPIIFKGDMNFQLRETFVEYCNSGELDFCRLAMNSYLETSRQFWRPMIKKFMFI